MNNTWLLVLLVLFSVVILSFLIWRNNKDRKSFEKEENRKDLVGEDKEGDIPVDMDRDDKV